MRENPRLRRKEAKKIKSKKFKSAKKRTENNEVLPVQVLQVQAQVLHQTHHLHHNLRTKEEEGKENKKVLGRMTKETRSPNQDQKKEETRDKEKSHAQNQNIREGSLEMMAERGRKRDLRSETIEAEVGIIEAAVDESLA